MKTFFALVCIIFLITGCATPSKTVSSSDIPPPPEPVSVEPPPEEYEINGYVKSEDGHPESSISVTFKNRTGETTQTKTNDEGYFMLSIKGKGHLHINDTDNNPLFVKTVNPVIFLKARGFIKIGKNEYNPKDKILIVLINSVWGAKYRNIKRMYEAEDYKQVIDIGRQFIVEYKDIKDALALTSEVESIISVAQNKFNEKEKQAKEKAEFETIINLNKNKNENYESIISRGENYIKEYRNEKGSNWEKIAGLVKEAKIRKRKVEEEREHARLREEDEKKRRPVVKKLCQKYELLGQATQMLKQLKEIDSFSGTVNLYERRQIAAAIVYTNKEIEQLKKEYKKLGGGEFSQKKCSSLKEDDLSDYGECIGDGCEDD